MSFAGLHENWHSSGKYVFVIHEYCGEIHSLNLMYGVLGRKHTSDMVAIHHNGGGTWRVGASSEEDRNMMTKIGL